jgi:hypothetical protein
MGRALKKDVNGVDVINTPAAAATGITCEFYDGSTNQVDGILIKQRGSRTYVVARIGTPGTLFTNTLVTGTPSAAGEMRIRGSTTGNLDTGLVSIAKLTKRVATDFSGNRYKWFLENDSSADYIVLTAI